METNTVEGKLNDRGSNPYKNSRIYCMPIYRLGTFINSIYLQEKLGVRRLTFK